MSKNGKDDGNGVTPSDSLAPYQKILDAHQAQNGANNALPRSAAAFKAQLDAVRGSSLTENPPVGADLSKPHQNAESKRRVATPNSSPAK